MKRLIKACGIVFFTLSMQIATAQKGTLIEFGWDYPDVSQLSANLPKMQNTPFDGVCFSLQRQIMEAFDTAVRSKSYYELDKLKQLQWGKYNSNFIILRGFGKTGGCWFDDAAWKRISVNMVNLSKALNNPGVRGILFDPEYYYDDQLFNPWTYNEKQYPTQSFAVVKAQVKKRGIQFIQAMQKYRTDFSFLSIWITSLIVEDRKYYPLEGTRHALLLPFIEGILEGKKPTVKVIDGNEYGYWNSKPSQFLDARAFLQKSLVDLMQSKKAKQEALKVGISQPLFYDGLLGKRDLFEKGYSTEAKWKWLEENIKFSIAAADDITWFYSHTINWWNGPGNDTLYNILMANKIDKPANTMLRSTTANIDKLTSRVFNINAGKGYYYLEAAKKPMQTGDVAFTYQLNAVSKKLSLNFADKLPDSISFFVNNLVVKTLKPKKNVESVVMDKYKKGKLVILAKYADKSEGVAIERYK